jgi:sporulation protein YlmC with PRC-barrel domain
MTLADAAERHVEQLIGRTVFDRQGQKVGRLEELIAEEHGNAWEVTELLIGTGALLQRMSVHLLGFVGRKVKPRGFRVSWQQLDLGDPKRMTLTCEVEELRKL